MNDPQHASLLNRLWCHCLTLSSDVVLRNNSDNQYIVANESQAQYFQCNSTSYSFLELLDGKKTVQEIVLVLAINQEALVELEILLNTLIEIGFIDKQQPKKQAPSWWKKLRYPIAMKFKLFNPNSVLHSLRFIADLMFNRFFALFFCFLLVTSLIILPQQWSALEEHWHSRFFETQNWLMFFFAYILLKSVHELGHALAVTKQGGNVSECGVLLLVFMPLPYTNASSSYLFPNRSQRVLVGLAGMWFELTLAMLAFIYWGTLTPGYFKDFVFNLSFIGSVSTLLFNLNPLMKFDGYYIFSDAIGVLNLNDKAVTSLKNLLKKQVFNLPVDNKSVDNSVHKYKFLFYLYAMLAIPYRVVIGLTIALYLSDSFFIFGLLLASWVLILMLCMPFFLNAKSVFKQSLKAHKMLRFFVISGSVCCLIFLLTFVKTYSFSNSYPTLTTAPAIQVLKAQTQGIIKKLHIENNQYVENSQLILTLDNPQLKTELNVSKAKLLEYKAQFRKAQFSDKAMAQSWQEKAQQQKTQVEQLSKKYSFLALTANNSGEVILNSFDDLTTSYLQRGDVVGHVIDNTSLTITAIIPQADIHSIRENSNTISVMFYTNPGETFKALLSDIKPAVYSQLPSRFLGSSAGGDIVVDTRDSTGKKALVPFFILELAVNNQQLSYLPARGIVRFRSAQITAFEYFWQGLKYSFSNRVNW